ncbi:MAG: Cysteinyl-tRNA synthetase, partial [uncultured Solirubrobacteraceae bacterium]
PRRSPRRWWRRSSTRWPRTSTRRRRWPSSTSGSARPTGRRGRAGVACSPRCSECSASRICFKPTRARPSRWSSWRAAAMPRAPHATGRAPMRCGTSCGSTDGRCEMAPTGPSSSGRP